MMQQDHTRARRQILRSFGAGEVEAEELLRYNENVFDRTGLVGTAFPLPDEPFVNAWEHYVEEVHAACSILPLQKYLVQLRFPVQEGMSSDPEYLAAVKTGEGVGTFIGQGLPLRAPEQCRLILHPTPAGRIPILIASVREDFRMLVQALGNRNEPVPIPDSMGACMIAGYRNWDRIRQVANALPGDNIADRLLNPEVQQKLKDKSSYQDRFLLLSSGSYSGVPAGALGVEEQEWTELSLVIRREHECAHYFTRRVFSSMRNNLIDEIIADYCGIVAALGRFECNWMLTFYGLEAFPFYRAGARLENYRGKPPVSESAFTVLQKLVKHAAENLQIFDAVTGQASSGPLRSLYALLTLCRFTLEDLASADALARLRVAFEEEQKACSGARYSQEHLRHKITNINGGDTDAQGVLHDGHSR